MISCSGMLLRNLRDMLKLPGMMFMVEYSELLSMLMKMSGRSIKSSGNNQRFSLELFICSREREIHGLFSGLIKCGAM